jgi:hypothetical protein
MSFDRSERDKRMLAKPTDAERTADALERIADALEAISADSEQERSADALERLVITADSIATALSLRALQQQDAPLQAHPFHEFKPHPDVTWMCERCGGGVNEDCHQRPSDG